MFVSGNSFWLLGLFHQESLICFQICGWEGWIHSLSQFSRSWYWIILSWTSRNFAYRFAVLVSMHNSKVMILVIFIYLPLQNEIPIGFHTGTEKNCWFIFFLDHLIKPTILKLYCSWLSLQAVCTITNGKLDATWISIFLKESSKLDRQYNVSFIAVSSNFTPPPGISFKRLKFCMKCKALISHILLFLFFSQ